MIAARDFLVRLLIVSPLIALAAWGCFGLTNHLIVAIDKIGDAVPAKEKTSALVDKAGAALDTVNRPCGGGHPCGTLANIDKAIVKIGDLLTSSQRQEIAVTNAAAANMASVNGMALHINKLADAGAETVQALTVDAKTANAAIASIQPLAEASTRTIDSLDARIRDPRIDALMDHIRGVSESSDAIAGDLRQVADKETKDFLRPTKWYLVPLKRGGQVIDIVSAIARNAP
jgi:hypothetical protein